MRGCIPKKLLVYASQFPEEFRSVQLSCPSPPLHRTPTERVPGMPRPMATRSQTAAALTMVPASGRGGSGGAT